MTPVLCVQDIDAARLHLRDRMGFAALPGNRLRFGAADLLLARPGQAPAEMIDLPLDHVAFAVPDADALEARLLAQGARRDGRFTPDGPRDIPEFWARGVRFVFFEGPEGAPFEFCARRGEADAQGHSHHALRVADTAATGAWLASQGAAPLAQHVLAATPRPVSVGFHRWGGSVIEVFDEAPIKRPGPGWIGLLPE